MKTLKLTLLLAGALAVAAPLAYSADSPPGAGVAGRAGKAADLLAARGFKVAGAAGAQTYEQQGGTLAKTPKPATTTASTGGGH
jgi:hypothetical protein